MRYLIDTDIASYFIRGDDTVARKLQQHLGDWSISSITYHELTHGLFKTNSALMEELFAQVLKDAPVTSFSSADAMESGRLMNLLNKQGTPIGYCDTLIAGHALSLKTILVTNNEKHFSKVKELKIENWMK